MSNIEDRRGENYTDPQKFVDGAVAAYQFAKQADAPKKVLDELMDKVKEAQYKLNDVALGTYANNVKYYTDAKSIDINALDKEFPGIKQRLEEAKMKIQVYDSHGRKKK